MLRIDRLRQRMHAARREVRDPRCATPARRRSRDGGPRVRSFGESGEAPAVAGARKGRAGNAKAPRAISPTALVLVAALAAGCGGGGGPRPAASGSDPSPPGSGPSGSNDYAQHSEYRAAWGFRATNAAAAYGRIAGRDGRGTAPGAGARVAVIDTGIDSGHWEFDGLAITGTGPSYPDGSHGTAVSSVIAAGRNGSRTPSWLSGNDFHGLAWELSRLEVKRVPLGSGSNENYVGTPVADVDDRVDWLAQQYSGLSATADFVNMSFAVRGLVENYRNLSFGPLYAPAIATLAQTGTQTGKTVLVIAAGNDHGDRCVAPEPNCVGDSIDASSPALFAGLPVLEASLRKHVVAVVATDARGRIASFSNRCGVAAKWCIAAPGVDIPVASSDGVSRGYSTASGTSLAAPHVTGGLAVLKHWFRSQLANENLLARLYETARVTPDPVSPGGSCPAHLDLDGDPSDCELSSSLGRGLMDLGAATAPVGTTYIALGGRVTVGGPPARASWIAPGAAVGDAMRRNLASREIAVFDALGAPFWIGADRFVLDGAQAGGVARLSRWLYREGGEGGRRDVAGEGDRRRPAMAAPPGDELRVGFGVPAGAHVAGLASRPAAVEMQLGDLNLLTFGSTASGDGTGPHVVDGNVRGLAMSWKPAGERAGFRAGWVGERETFLGSGAEGAFGNLSSDLVFVGASESFEADGWRLDVAAELGWASAEPAGGMLADGGAATYSSAFSAGAARSFAGGTLRLSVEQPLRVESGRMGLSFPTGRTPEGAVKLQRIDVGLEPSGRQLDFGIDWTGALGADGIWRVGTVLSHQPGHDTGRDAEAVFLAGVRFRL